MNRSILIHCAFSESLTPGSRPAHCGKGAWSMEHGTREHGSSFTSVDLKTNPAVTREARLGIGS